MCEALDFAASFLICNRLRNDGADPMGKKFFPVGKLRFAVHLEPFPVAEEVIPPSSRNCLQTVGMEGGETVRVKVARRPAMQYVRKTFIRVYFYFVVANVRIFLKSNKIQQIFAEKVFFRTFAVVKNKNRLYMQLSIDNREFDKFLMIGEKVLVKPTNPQGKTKSGLLLPPSVQEGEKLQTGYVIKTGPGIPLPPQSDAGESWKEKEEIDYIPLQAKSGDLAVYLQSAGYEVVINDEKYVILTHSSIMMLLRDKELFE
jgi:co-chaperonin GroES (HSP10)